MKLMKKIADVIVFALTGKGEIGNNSVDENIIDYSGQGRNEYGK